MSARPGLATFTTLYLEGPEIVADVAGSLSRAAGELLSGAAGLHRARVHVGKGEPVVVLGTWWNSRAERRSWFEALPPDAVLRNPGSEPGVTNVRDFAGTPLAGIEGPAAGRTAGMVAIATRTVGDHAAARAIAGLLERTGEWKQRSPGFVSASAHVDLDGTCFVNYPQWVDEAAFRTYMSHPRLEDGRHDVARYETAAPEFLLCTIVSEVPPGPASTIS